MPDDLGSQRCAQWAPGQFRRCNFVSTQSAPPDAIRRSISSLNMNASMASDNDRDLYPLLLTADGRQMSAWSLADVHRRLLKKDEIQMSYSTLRRTFRRFGYQPQAPPKKAPASLRAGRPHEWNYPWPAEYGRSMADFLQKTGNGE